MNILNIVQPTEKGDLGTWYTLVDLHEELSAEYPKAHPAALDWLRRVGGADAVKIVNIGKGRCTLVHNRVLPLVSIWVARRVSTRTPRKRLSKVYREVRHTGVFDAIHPSR